ncbi:hypothetical protein [Marinobacter sp. CHS3-4]|uniref:hypothetical protein n=1 Tax=Marinobacter sp. CHS3-4 TaxID=3045174 RepID=UPI0024B52A88|nr:hypothetical protein [Marinobacter sp. CHS3-4]MDI9245740.1 hypothetical protein [Marinobacter sp. CHS3-4]
MAELFLIHQMRLLFRQTAIVAMACAMSAAQADEATPRASDTGYGMALYEYHQGNFFQALTRLNVVNREGGIAGHGDHPLLVEGGLMLAYGMTREAQRQFQALLDTSDVSDEARNQAWFYLGKVFWLEKDRDASTDALSRVDGELLEESDPELYHEWLYLKGQWLLGQSQSPESRQQLDDLLDELPVSSPWRFYLRYNRSVQSLTAGDQPAAMDELEALIADTSPDQDQPSDVQAEMLALEQQARLSLGRLHMGKGDFERAMRVLDEIPLDGMLSDQALFNYAVSASRQEQHGLALQALDALQKRPLFTPWLQQVPYARAFTIEQMGRNKQALAAYRRAAEHYVQLDQRLTEEQASLSESRLINALAFVREGAENTAPDADLSATGPALGESTMLTDAYGRVKVRPDDFSLAELLAGEAFQLALRDMHELYRLDDSLDQWRQQLASFEVMLDTRRTRREARIRETREALASMKVDEWTDRQEAFRKDIEQASANENAAFFMTAEQKALKNQLDRVENTLAGLPVNEKTRQQRQTYERMRAYFDWWVADEYGVNRWAAVKQLRELDEAMDTFVSQRKLMEEEMASDDRLDEFASRIARKKAELDRLDRQLDLALEQTRQSLMNLVQSELARQRQQVTSYLRASRHAQARLADGLFLNAREAAVQQNSGRPDDDTTVKEGSDD